MQQEREEVYAALQFAASFHCLVEEGKDCEELRPKKKEMWVFVEKKSDNTKHQTQWCAEADKYQCMRCGRGSKYMKIPGSCTAPKILVKKFGNMLKTTFGRPRPGEKSRQAGRGSDMVREYKA